VRSRKKAAPSPRAGLYYPTPTSPEEAFRAIGRLRKEARDEIDRLIRFLDESDNHMELEPDGGDEPSLGWITSVSQGSHCGGTDDLEADDSDDEPSLGSHELPSGALCYSQSASFGEVDVEGEHDGREPGEDDEPALGWHNTEPQYETAGGSMHACEEEPSLGSTATINQTAWAFGRGGDLECDPTI
jgi:hypothetical protein